MDLLVLRSRGVWEPNADVVIDEAARLLVVRVELAGPTARVCVYS